MIGDDDIDTRVLEEFQNQYNVPSGVDWSDPEMVKLYRQSGIAEGGGSAIGGMGTNWKDLPLVDVSGGGSDLDKLLRYIKKVGSGQGGLKDYGTLLAGVGLLRELMGKDGKRNVSYKGPGVNMGLRATRAPVSLPAYQPYTGKPVMGQQMAGNVTYAAEGGVMGLARGRQPRQPRYLRGETDGMEDKIPTTIEDKQPAKLSHGEFVIPADVVSHLGNGNSDAGAKVLYRMMDRVRQARTGTKKQGKRINPAKFTPGGIAGYDAGGIVAFEAGGPSVVPNQDPVTLPTAAPAPAPVAAPTVGGTATPSTGGPVMDTNLANWAGPYVMDYLSKAQALSNEPYKAYEGPLVAGTSPLQQQAFAGISGLQPYSPTTITSGYTAPAPYEAGKFDTGLGAVKSVQEYMSPYTSAVTDIQAREARRQADIGRTAEQARLAQAGAYGGSRQAIMEAERQRNLNQQIGDITEKGLQSAYDRAMEQRLKESGLGLEAQKAGETSRQFGATQASRAAEVQAQQALEAQRASEASKQFGAGFGLQSLQTQLAAGAQQQAQEQKGLDALYQQWREAQLDPYNKLKFQQSMLQGLPVGVNTGESQTTLEKLLGGASGLAAIYELLGKVSD